MVDDKVAGGLEELKVLKLVERTPIDVHSHKLSVCDQVSADRPGEVILQ